MTLLGTESSSRYVRGLASLCPSEGQGFRSVLAAHHNLLYNSSQKPQS